MKQHPRLRLLAMWLSLCASVSAQASGATDAPIQPPRYPAELAKSGAEGTTILLLTTDTEGKVVAVEVETSSGYEALDQAATDAALLWRFNPAGNGQTMPRIRVPVEFRIPTPSESDDMAAATDMPSLEEHRHWQQLWQQMQVAPVATARDGSLPGYLTDPLPLPAESAEAIVQLLNEKATRQPESEDGVIRYEWSEGPLISFYEVFDAGWSNNLTVLRSRLVTDGQHAFWMQRYQCDAPDPAECTRFEARLRKAPRQRGLDPPLPPPPPPPPAPPPA